VGGKQFKGLIKFIIPAEVYGDGSCQAQEIEGVPAAKIGDPDYAGVEQSDIGEKRNLPVNASAEEKRGQKTTQYA